MSRAYGLVVVMGLAVADCAAAENPADAGAIIVPGACFVHAPSERASTIDRIELQLMQVIAKDGQPVGGVRVQLGIQPKGGDDIMPSGLSAPCTGVDHNLSCTLKCNDTDKHSRLGKFRIEPGSSKDRIELIIETPLTLNACSPEEKPSAVKRSLVGKTFRLRLAASNNCFH